VATQLGGGTDEILFVGDDLVDLPAFSLAGVTVAVGDAVAEVKQVADLTTGRPGGRGAIREAAEWLLREQGKWADLVQRYTGKGGTPAGQA
jgi:3-deoxy-D-manno-octulosonate 8-phosphate phosphatase (KDO 8-P phosphatase)